MANKIKVLVVDDQPLVLDILSKGLVQDPEIEISGTATDGYLALNMINRSKPDVIILDMEMPRMNGIQFLHQLNATTPIPTIVLSALTDPNSKITQDAFDAGAVDFLPKPSSGARGLLELIKQLWIKIKIAATQDVTHLKKPLQTYKLPSNVLDRKATTKNMILGMGAMGVTDNPEQFLKIFALGSCVGLTLFCPSKNVVAMSHVALPASKTDAKKAEDLPGYFGDTVVSALLSKMAEYGCMPNMIFAKIAGGAKTQVELGDFFNIGQKNIISVKSSLIKHQVKLLAEDVGGEISRTVYVKGGDKFLTIHHPSKGNWQI